MWFGDSAGYMLTQMFRMSRCNWLTLLILSSDQVLGFGAAGRIFHGFSVVSANCCKKFIGKNYSTLLRKNMTTVITL
jgi:hypothetical protein